MNSTFFRKVLIEIFYKSFSMRFLIRLQTFPVFLLKLSARPPARLCTPLRTRVFVHAAKLHSKTRSISSQRLFTTVSKESSEKLQFMEEHDSSVCGGISSLMFFEQANVLRSPCLNHFLSQKLICSCDARILKLTALKQIITFKILN